jgi:hypothetical protein
MPSSASILPRSSSPRSSSMLRSSFLLPPTSSLFLSRVLVVGFE